jgi:hypothetical protein
MRVSAIDCAFEHRVLALRLNSCVKKSNRQPIDPPGQAQAQALAVHGPHHPVPDGPAPCPLRAAKPVMETIMPEILSC